MIIFYIVSIIPTLVSENFLLSIKIINLKFKKFLKREQLIYF